MRHRTSRSTLLSGDGRCRQSVSGRGLALPCSLSVPPQHCRSIVRFSARLLPALHGNTTRPRCDCASDLLQHLDDPSCVLTRGSRFGLSAVCWRAACGSTLGSRARLLQLSVTAGAAGCAGSSSGESMSSSLLFVVESTRGAGLFSYSSNCTSRCGHTCSFSTSDLTTPCSCGRCSQQRHTW